MSYSRNNSHGYGGGGYPNPGPRRGGGDQGPVYDSGMVNITIQCQESVNDLDI